ncbi:MAG: hypothetical protein OEY36_08450 [Gammaproteobacteria bacterium]|nr:hypothetical protein [Gammaproteobacteria bacterium]
MNPFQEFLNTLSDETLSDLESGKLHISVDDNSYITSTSGVSISQYQKNISENIKQLLIDNQDSILQQLYKTYPLCRKEFDFQAQQLIMQSQAESFCSHGSMPNKQALFIDGNFLAVVGSTDARYKYGYYCQHEDNLNQQEAKQAVIKWLESGQAYEDYRVKTHCRYICGTSL